MAIKIDHCVIHITNREVSNEFYERVVGALLVQRDAGCVYSFGDAQLNVHGPGINPAPWPGFPSHQATATYASEWPGSVEDAQRHLEANGVKIEVGLVPRNGAKGPGMSLYLRDPDGSLLEFICYG